MKNGAGRWTERRVMGLALLVAYLSSLPVVGVAVVRIGQIRASEASWARLAEASRWLSSSTVCQGSVSAGLAEADLTRWQDAVDRLLEAERLLPPALFESVSALQQELATVRRAPEGGRGAWVEAHCGRVERLGAQVLARAVQLGTDPSSRLDRYEDLALRDLATALALWVVGAVLLWRWARVQVVAPARRLAPILQRIAGGDLQAAIPELPPGPTQEMAAALRDAVHQWARRDEAKSERLRELRAVLRRTVELVPEPVLILGVDERLHYANASAAEAFDDACRALEGCELAALPGGDTMRQLLHDVLGAAGDEADWTEVTSSLGQEVRLKRWALVRDGTGLPSRVILVFEAQAGQWWQRLWRDLAAKG